MPSSTSRVRVSGPLVPYVQGFAAELERLGYTAGSAKHQLLLLAHLSRWLGDQDRDDGPVGLEEIAAFVAARREAGRRLYRSIAGMSTLIEYLAGMGLIAEETCGAVSPVEELLERYRSYLIGERGLAVSTVRGYIGAIRPFLENRAAGAGGELALTTLSAAEVAGFLLGVCRDRQPSTGQGTATALRSLLGFLHIEGVVDPSLANAVRSVASWKLSPLPRALEPAEVSRLPKSCDRRTSLGRRDVAMLLLLVRLGLRAGEVAALELDDLDWGPVNWSCPARVGVESASRCPMTSGGRSLATCSAAGLPRCRDGRCSCDTRHRTIA